MSGSQATAAPPRPEEAEGAREKEEPTEKAQRGLVELTGLAEEGAPRNYSYPPEDEARIVELFRSVWPCVLGETKGCSNGRVKRATAPTATGDDGDLGPADPKAAVQYNGDEEGASALRAAAQRFTKAHLTFVTKFLPTELRRPA